MSEEPLPMLQGKFPEIRKMSRKDMEIEIQAWRNLWSYTPSEVKYYLLKSGTTMAVTMRNYKRHLGVLLSTRWDIKELEMGVAENEYDQTSGQYYLETKIIKLSPSSMLDLQWIQSRQLVESLIGQQAEQVVSQSVEQEQSDEQTTQE